MKDRHLPGGLLLGLTGGIGCGKSEVGRMLRAAGVSLLDTDDVARAVMAPGGPAYADVVARFGEAILRPDGFVDRVKLGQLVFTDAEARTALNRMVHPHVHREWKDWARKEREQDRVAVVIIPLLFEVGADKEVDAVICVTAPEQMVVERLACRGLTPQQVRQRMAAQLPLSEKKKKADYVIENSSTMDALEEETQAIVQTILKKKEKEKNG